MQDRTTGAAPIAETRRERPTMRDVAKLAGVSLKTVSRVVNGEVTVAAELVQKVQEAASELHYRPNLAANLKRGSGRASTIGLLIQNVSNEFSASVYRAVEDVAGLHGVQVLASNVDEDPDRERTLAASLIARRVDGLIVVPASHDHGYLQQEQHFGTPIVFLDRPPVNLVADSVLSDNLTGAEAGVLHLLEQGHRRVGFLGEPPEHLPARQRYKGYCKALAGAGVEVDERIVARGLSDDLGAREATTQMLADADPPTAIFSAHNVLTVGAVRGIRAHRGQDRIGLVGFDDLSLFDLLLPAVTVVAQDPRGMASLGANILFQRIGGDTSPVQEHVVPTHLVARGTGEIGPGRSRRASR